MNKNVSFMAIIALVITISVSSCGNKKGAQKESASDSIMKQKVDEYASVKLTADLSRLTEKEKEMLPFLFEAAEIMNDLYWLQTYGDNKKILDSIKDENVKKFFMINYGPWDRLKDNKSFIAGIGEKPAGANFYPADMTKEEFEKLQDPNKKSQYTVIRRNADKSLKVVWYHEEYKEQLQKAADLITKASAFAENKDFKNYLELTAKAIMTSDYYARDMAWMDMRGSNVDFVFGPTENYEDALFGTKTAFEAFVLIKDMDWSAKLDKFAKLLPTLQKSLPCDAKYKKEVPAAGSDMGVYEAIFYRGDCNAGSKTIAINLPNDERVQLKKGSRKLQLKNSMKAKFDNMVIPIGNLLITESQRKNIKFEAFFQNTMFHEVAHGIGIKNTLNKKGSVREALGEEYSGLEEDKADITGLFLAKKLHEMGELSEGEVMDNYVTFVAGIFRSIRFGTASAHGKANLARYNFLMGKGAITRDSKGFYTVNFDKMTAAMEELIGMIMKIQGEGDKAGANKYITENGVKTKDLTNDLDKIKNANIPRDIVFEQGMDVAGIKKK
ncbi:MAG: Zn-dependent hydrolase [Bacteroidota bacterium]